MWVDLTLKLSVCVSPDLLAILNILAVDLISTRLRLGLVLAGLPYTEEKNMVVVYQYPNYKLLLAENISEDKEFIQYGIPTDVWFRLENSAKSTPCYYRPSSPLSSLDEIPPSVLKECAFAIKAQANLKRDLIPLLYTFVSNVNSNGPINQGEVSQHTVKTKQQTAPRCLPSASRWTSRATNSNMTEMLGLKITSSLSRQNKPNPRIADSIWR